MTVTVALHAVGYYPKKHYMSFHLQYMFQKLCWAWRWASSPSFLLDASAVLCQLPCCTSLVELLRAVQLQACLPVCGCILSAERLCSAQRCAAKQA